LTQAEVRALYEILLGRSPESDQAVETHLNLHNSLTSVARSLCASDEFLLRVRHEVQGPVSRADVEALYEILLGRLPESDEVIEMHRSLHDSVISLARSICNSEEAHLRATGQASAPLTRSQVRGLYETLFGRTLENEEMIQAQLNLHQSAVSLAQSLCDPDQILMRIKNEADDSDMRAVYKIVLGPPPKSGEPIETQLSNYKSVVSLAHALCDTDELLARVRREAERPVTRADVRELYEMLLGRQPESEQIIEMHTHHHDSATSLVRALCRSEEYNTRIRSEADRWFDGYRPEELNILRAHLSHSKPEAGFVKDFVGTRMRVRFNSSVSALSGVVFDHIPVPGDFRVETIEWVGVLKAIETSGAHFVTVELGAGWGPWVVSSGHVARGLGKTVRMYAVEADPGKVPNIAQHMTDNGFDPKDHVIFGGIAGRSDGFAYFPVIDAAGNWSGEAVYDEPPQGEYQKLPSISLGTLVKDEETVDLIHFDIQGAEFDVVKGSIEQLCAKVRWMVIGTHSRSIEGRLIDLLLQSNWSLENEQPCRCSYGGGRSHTFVDGTQVWRNLASTNSRSAH
jgi:FkbM family methyltransferase